MKSTRFKINRRRCFFRSRVVEVHHGAPRPPLYIYFISLKKTLKPDLYLERNMAAPSAHISGSRYDVFLSFRGKDTRKIFVDHLYYYLVVKGINTFKDDKSLTKGERIHPALMKAIEESKIALIIFSENYGDSSSCLRELAHIMKCKVERNLIVMPIFYDVFPDDVQEQKGNFGRGFAKHQSSNVESWRKALVEAAKLLGWEPKMMADGRESDSSREIANAVSELLGPTLNANEGLIGIETRMQGLDSCLEIGSGATRMVGIWGVGGGGKTTLASSVYKKYSDKFDGCCFVGNIREASIKYGLEKLQEKVLLDLKIQETTWSVKDVRLMISSRLRSRKVLLVLDDVACHEHLDALAGSHNWFGKGSLIIITTTDKNLLNAHKVDATYNISLLTEQEAIRLFYKHALGKSQSKEDHGKLLNLSEVLSYAGGLPLALKVLGMFLCDKDAGEWKSTLARLKDTPVGDFVQKLKVSYDGLSSIDQELFLDIACFFRHHEKDEAMMILDACGFHPVVGVKVLIQKALISIKVGKFDMDDVVQAMGHYIVRGNHTNNPEEHSRVW